MLRFPRTLSAAQALFFLGSLPRIGGQGLGAQLDAGVPGAHPARHPDSPTLILRTAIAYTWSS